MSPDRPAVGILLAVRNRERYVAEAIDSILGQTVPPDEIVVVDDGSDDATPEILAGYGNRIRVVRQEPSGQFTAMNRAVAVSTTPVLGFLDSDDLFTPRSIELRLDRLDADDAPEAVFGHIEQFVSPELDPADAARLRFEAGLVSVELLQSMLIRRSAFDRVGPLDERMVTSSNIDWISRAREAGLRSVSIDDLVTRRRLHLTNIGRTAADRKHRDLLTIVRRHRRRTSSDDAPG